MDESRKQFHDWVLSRPDAEHDDIVMRSDEYLRILTTFMWEAWTASRAAVEIKLPTENELHQKVCSGCASESLEMAEEAIRAAGIKVKE